jgi:hypothetical protein
MFDNRGFPPQLTCSGLPVTFAARGDGMLKLDASASFKPGFVSITGFGGNDKIDLADIAFGPHTTLAVAAFHSNPATLPASPAGDILAVSDGTHTARLLLIGQHTAASFAMASDGHGGTLITDTAASRMQMMLANPHP